MNFIHWFCPCLAQCKVLSLGKLIDWLSYRHLLPIGHIGGEERRINLAVDASGMPMASEVEGQMNLLSLQKCTKEDEVLLGQQ